MYRKSNVIHRENNHKINSCNKLGIKDVLFTPQNLMFVVNLLPLKRTKTMRKILYQRLYMALSQLLIQTLNTFSIVLRNDHTPFYKLVQRSNILIVIWYYLWHFVSKYFLSLLYSILLNVYLLLLLHVMRLATKDHSFPPWRFQKVARLVFPLFADGK